LKTALQMDPNNGLAHAYNAFLYGKMFEENAGPYVDPVQTAIDESRAATMLAPNSLEASWARAYVLQLTDNAEQAITEYERAISINKNIFEIHLALGVTYRSLDATEQALQEYMQANTINPADYRPDLYSSRALSAIGEFSQAAQYAETAVNDAPTDPYLRGNWGYMLYKANDLPAALEQLSLAIDGGELEDGQTVQPVSLTEYDTVWVSRYYYSYAILLAQSDYCGEAVLLTQKILDYFRADEYAVPNVEYALGFCNLAPGTPAAQPSVTPVDTPAP